MPIFKPKRVKVLYGGRGSGKSWTIARTIIAMCAERPLRVLCARETQKSIQESVHRLLKDQIGYMGLHNAFDVMEQKICGRNGSEITFIGIRQQGVANLKSYEGTDICWIEEAANVTTKSWDVLIPTIRKERSEIWLSFNPELDTDPTYQRFVENPPDDSWVVQVNYNDNPFFPVELEKERLQWKQRDPVGYETVWEGKCRPTVEGAIYTKEIQDVMSEGRIRNVPYDPQLKVHSVWDLGWNDSMAIILVQMAASELRVIDFIEDSHRTLESYIKELETRDWNWGTDYLPHDATHKDFKHGKSTEEMLRGMGRDVFTLGRMDVEQGIMKTRMVMPRIWFDKERTKDLVNHIKRYRRTINSAGEPSSPLHDEHSHAADCLRYLCTSCEFMTNESWGHIPQPNHRWVV